MFPIACEGETDYEDSTGSPEIKHHNYDISLNGKGILCVTRTEEVEKAVNVGIGLRRWRLTIEEGRAASKVVI